jgi:hypothetical protein
MNIHPVILAFVCAISISPPLSIIWIQGLTPSTCITPTVNTLEVELQLLRRKEREFTDADWSNTKASAFHRKEIASLYSAWQKISTRQRPGGPSTLNTSRISCEGDSAILFLTRLSSKIFSCSRKNQLFRQYCPGLSQNQSERQGQEM